jgi:hypothetical protein
MVLCPTPPPPRHYGRHDYDYGLGKSKTSMTTTAMREQYLKSSHDIFKTTTGTTATSSDNDHDNDIDCDYVYNYNYGTAAGSRPRPSRTRRHRDVQPFYFDIEDDPDAADDEEDRHDFILPTTSTPLSVRDYSWDESSRDSVSTISTWKSFELEDRNPSAERSHRSEHDDGGGAPGRWESPHGTEIAAGTGQVIIMPAKYSRRKGGPNLDGQRGLPIENTGDETVWSQSLVMDPVEIQVIGGDCEHYKLALIPMLLPRTPETVTFGPPLETAINAVSVKRGVKSEDDTPRPVMGPWIDFRLSQNPFAVDSEFSSDDDDNDMPHSPFAPIEQPPLAPTKAFVVASPQADRPSLISFCSSCTSSHGEPTDMWTETTPRDREQAVETIAMTTLAGCSATTAYSIADHRHRVPIQQAPAPRAKKIVTKLKLARGDESVAVLGKGKRMPESACWSRQSNVASLQASGEAVASGSKAAAKLAKSFIAKAKVDRQNMVPGSTAEQILPDKESTEMRPGSRAVIEPVRRAFADRSISRRQTLGQGTCANETIKSDPVKSFVSSNSRSTRPNVRQEGASDPAKSPVGNAKSGSQLLGQGTVVEQQRQEKDSTGSNEPSCSTQRRAPILLGHLLEKRYQAALRKDVLPQRPVAAGGKSAESGALGDATRSIQENPAMAKYTRMLKVGHPTSAVKNDALEPDGAEMGVFEDGISGQNEKCAPSTLGDDPAFAEHARTLKVGLPLSATRNAMEQDGVDPCLLDGGTPGPSTAGEKELVPLEATRDPFRRFRLHWDTHSNLRSNTIWAMISRDQEWLAEMQVDEEELDTLFRTPKTSAVVVEPSGTTANRVGNDNQVQVIDAKRAQNGGIRLARIKVSYRDVAIAVESYDNAALTLEQIRSILPYIPTPEETRDLKDYISKGGRPKSECEKFMVEIMTVDEAKRKLGK